MDIYSSKGWLNRRRAAAARDADYSDPEREFVRAERAKMYQAEADANEAAREAHRAALEAARCGCPACAGSGLVTVEVAAGLMEAWHRYREQGYAPSQRTVAALADIARGVAPAPGAVIVTATYGMSLPTPNMASQTPVVETVEPPKPAKPSKLSKTLEDDSTYTADGALIEL